MTTKIEAIRTLNDELRQNLSTGRAFLTAGIAALGAEAIARIVKTIAVYDDFCHANDPYEEHDFGSFEVDAFQGLNLDARESRYTTGLLIRRRVAAFLESMAVDA